MANMTQHNPFGKNCAVDVPYYSADLLGAPFKVILVDGVTQTNDDGKLKTDIPELTGLFKAVVQSRVFHTRKLNGEELKFIRKVVGFKAKSLAKQIDVTPEHLSRCEAGTKVLSGSSEKLFRMTAFIGSFCINAEATLGVAAAEKSKAKAKSKKNNLSSEVRKDVKDLWSSFLSMDIQTVYDVNNELCFEFSLDRAGESCGGSEIWNKAA